ncbi:penicillin-binding protein 2 [Actinocorallia sp. A-T 12471]|uniref:peptidoglycan D,D-transpeptidase FtsI family protein n=1 Tax=Actinocorallia sp. A-T 12471 TaxID=3089813 RepID=UPI0029CC029F|nr:penicillin-binding protein 2 [Actinocorallia sp. A-T 12471]MDX6743077.1 penicillin-binding protein 2 [Actinocorallia sp. A-T 12471]
MTDRPRTPGGAVPPGRRPRPPAPRRRPGGAGTLPGPDAPRGTGTRRAAAEGRATEGRAGEARAGETRPQPPRPRPPRRPPPRRRQTMRLKDPMKRLNAGLLIIAFVLSLFAGRLVQLQGIDSEKYEAAAIKQRLRLIELPAVRGIITDASGAPLALTQEARGVFADPSMIDPAKRTEIAARLSSMLGLDVQQVLEAISTPKTRYVPLAHAVTPEKGRLVLSLGYRGIGVVPESRRSYPADAVAANVIGFVNQDGDGGAGLEYAQNKLLKGVDGWQRVEISAGEGQHIPMGEGQTKDPVPGQGLRLHLDQDIQWQAQEALAEAVKKHKAESGTVIVMTPDGKILAMASAPTFDPNDYAKASGSALQNRVVQEAFEPGSTGKIITAAALLEEGLVTPETPFTVPDHIWKYTKKFKDSHSHPPYKNITFAGILAKSSNVGTILASENLPDDKLYNYLTAFGFGSQTGVGLPGETAGLLNPPKTWSGTDRYPISFGQTVSVNALQMASVYATIANGGVRVTPTLVAGSLDEEGAFTAAPAPQSRRVIREETARQLVSMLEGAVGRDGTAASAQIPGYRVAGKTGTAERYVEKAGGYEGYTASFAGMAPADDPQLIVQVVLQDPKPEYYGGVVAAPVFQKVMSFALKSRKVPPTGTVAPTLKMFAD